MRRVQQTREHVSAQWQWCGNFNCDSNSKKFLLNVDADRPLWKLLLLPQRRGHIFFFSAHLTLGMGKLLSASDDSLVWLKCSYKWREDTQISWDFCFLEVFLPAVPFLGEREQRGYQDLHLCNSNRIDILMITARTRSGASWWKQILILDGCIWFGRNSKWVKWCWCISKCFLLFIL